MIVFTQPELIAEYNAAGTLLKRYVHGIGSDDPLVSFDGSGTTSPTYLLADERGSIMAETNSAGTVTTKHQYGPYGEPINQSASRFRYTGQILLPGTALYHYKARVYHPKLGRFLQTDPIGYKDGMNWYAYVGNDPMNAVDQDGTCGTRIKGKTSVECSDYGVGSNLSKSSDSSSRSLGSYLPTLNQGVVDAVTRFGDGIFNAVTFGFGDLNQTRESLGIIGGFNSNNLSYKASYLGGTGVGLLASGGAFNTMLRPSSLTHFTSFDSAAAIAKSGVINPTRGLYGTGVYTTALKSRAYATIQGARSTQASFTFSTNGLTVVPTLFPGTFRVIESVRVVKP